MRYSIIQNTARTVVIVAALLMLVIFGAALIEVTPGKTTGGNGEAEHTTAGPVLKVLVFTGDAGGMASSSGASGERSIFLDIPATILV